MTELMRTADAHTAERLKRFQRRAEEQQHLLLDDLEMVSRTDGAYAWRMKQLTRLGNIVQERIVKLQVRVRSDEKRFVFRELLLRWL